jgi:hypothetical protein
VSLKKCGCPRIRESLGYGDKVHLCINNVGRNVKGELKFEESYVSSGYSAWKIQFS